MGGTFNTLAAGTRTNVTWTDNGTTVDAIDQFVASAANHWGGAGLSGCNDAVQMPIATISRTYLSFAGPNA